MNKSSEQNVGQTADSVARVRIREELDRNFLVEAAAGTGKTTCIVDRMVNLIASGRCEMDRLAAVTFTRNAAAELRERFQAALGRRAAELQGGKSVSERASFVRLQSASDFVGRAYVGTIHGLCASMLRERPIEFGVDPAFRELTEAEDQALREQAWYENINDLFAAADPLIERIDAMGLDRADLKSCFDRFIEYRDVEHWPCENPADFDLEWAQRQTRDYIRDMGKLEPLFPADRGNDKLMARYEEIVRAGDSDWGQNRNLFSLLEKFDTSPSEVLGRWHDKTVARTERDRFKRFRAEVASPALQWWRRKRYQFVVEFVRRAVAVYESQKAASRSLDFNDLLLKTARGLRDHSALRRYFQNRYSHVLIDEFQDTDPIQAEMLLFLTSEDVKQQDAFRCSPRPGSLFLVGDPKQSIYRFRRGDIVTYNRVKRVFEQSGGVILPLVRNFRSQERIRDWNNQVYQKKFGTKTTEYSVAAEDMLQGRTDAKAGELSGVHKLILPAQATIVETSKQEAESIARFIRQAIDSRRTIARTARELEQGRPAHVEARDFLIIPRGKRRIDLYKEALDRLNVPCAAIGGNALLDIDELNVLVECLKTLDDPYNPVHYLAVLRDRLFAFSDADLYELKRCGGRFAFTSDLPTSLDKPLAKRFTKVNASLKQYQLWLRVLPFPVAICRIACDLGVFAASAARADGNVALGGLLKALEGVRQSSADFDSAADLIGYIEQLEQVDEAAGCTALTPATNVVRIMNLHKVKGLESPVVFLADTAKRYAPNPVCHIDRSGAHPIGYMGITAAKGKWATKEVATPEGWTAHQEEEQKFRDAEADRLLYVATTRAACMLVVSIGRDDSNWSGLHNELAGAASLQIPQGDIPAPDLPPIPAPVSSTRTLDQKWAQTLTAGYRVESAKEVALQGRTRPKWSASGDYGHLWGSALHGLLEVAQKTPQVDLRASALMFANQFEIAAERVNELLATAQAVTKSEVWRRSQDAHRQFSELPLEIVSTDADGRTVITRGVIDLIFEETNGWVLVDYKTDDIAESNLEEAVAYYRSQLELYAANWRDATGFAVSELGLYFTRIDSYAIIEDSCD